MVRIHGDRTEYEVIARRGGLAIKENVVVLGVIKAKVGVLVKSAVFVPDGIQLGDILFDVAGSVPIASLELILL